MKTDHFTKPLCGGYMKNFQSSSLLKDKSFALAVRIVRLGRYLMEDKKEFIISKQLVRAGTNPGAMIREAQNAESGKDFIHKLSIAQKEIGETVYWLELLHETDYLNGPEFDSINSDIAEVMQLLTSSILTRKKNLQKTITFGIFVVLSSVFLLL
jgi:four helix bundle protein